MLSCFPNVKWDKLLWKAVERPNWVFSFKFNFRTSLGELNEGVSPFADPLIYIPTGSPSIFCLGFAANHQLNKTSSALNSKLPSTKKRCHSEEFSPMGIQLRPSRKASSGSQPLVSSSRDHEEHLAWSPRLHNTWAGWSFFQFSKWRTESKIVAYFSGL